MKAFDEVNGVIVGGDYMFYAVIAPNGKEQTRFYSDNDSNAIVRYQDYIESIKCREDIMEMIYGRGEWQLCQLF